MCLWVLQLIIIASAETIYYSSECLDHLAKTPQCFHSCLSLFIGVGSCMWDFSDLLLLFNFNHRI